MLIAVVVILQPMKEEPAINAKSRDKFLLQSCIINVEQEAKPLHDLVSIRSPLLLSTTI